MDRGGAASERLCVCNHAEIKAEHHSSSVVKLRQVGKGGERKGDDDDGWQRRGDQRLHLKAQFVLDKTGKEHVFTNVIKFVDL